MEAISAGSASLPRIRRHMSRYSACSSAVLPGAGAADDFGGDAAPTAVGAEWRFLLCLARAAAGGGTAVGFCNLTRLVSRSAMRLYIPAKSSEKTLPCGPLGLGASWGLGAVEGRDAAAAAAPRATCLR